VAANNVNTSGSASGSAGLKRAIKLAVPTVQVMIKAPKKVHRGTKSNTAPVNIEETSQVAEPLSPPDSCKVRHRPPGSGQFGGPYCQKEQAQNYSLNAQRVAVRCLLATPAAILISAYLKFDL
jgi:hypothetical protein